VELNSTLMLSGAKASPPPPASTPRAFLNRPIRHHRSHPAAPTTVAVSTQGSIGEANKIHAQISRQSLEPRRLLLEVLKSNHKFSSQSKATHCALHRQK
jgi:hypothetical protein